MEVAGLTASIITLIGAATLAGSTVSRIWGLRDSPPLYVLTALNEINDFKATLSLIQCALENLPTTPPDFIDEEIARFLRRAETSLTAFNNYLQEKVLRGGAGDSDTIKLRRRAKLKEILGEAQSEMNVLQQELTSIKLSLNTALTAMNIRNSGRLTMSIQQVSVVRSGLMTTLEGETQAITTAFVEEAVMSSAVGNTRHPSANCSSGQAIDGLVVIETQSNRCKCQKHCPCQCHVAYGGNSPKWLQGLFGAAFFNFTGLPLLNRRSCNFRNCANGATQKASIHVQYVFPTWALPFAIEFSASWRYLGGIGGSWSLKIPRIFPDHVRRLNYILRHGTVADLQIAMHEHGLRAFDIFDGWCGSPTLFSVRLQSTAILDY
jgi:hypothetical protein